jgi:hypothetical protein
VLLAPSPSNFLSTLPYLTTEHKIHTSACQNWIYAYRTSNSAWVGNPLEVTFWTFPAPSAIPTGQEKEFTVHNKSGNNSQRTLKPDHIGVLKDSQCVQENKHERSNVRSVCDRSSDFGAELQDRNIRLWV